MNALHQRLQHARDSLYDEQGAPAVPPRCLSSSLWVIQGAIKVGTFDFISLCATGTDATSLRSHRFSRVVKTGLMVGRAGTQSDEEDGTEAKEDVPTAGGVSEVRHGVLRISLLWVAPRGY